MLYRALALTATLALIGLGAPANARGDSFVFVFDSVGTGTSYQLTSFDGTTLTGANRQGPLVTTFDENTIFRAAHLNRYSPVDPCRTFAANYNAAGATGDSTGLLAAITQLATNGCVARVNVVNSLSPVDPCRSFRPLPTP
jgi:hypothetical protein